MNLCFAQCCSSPELDCVPVARLKLVCVGFLRALCLYQTIENQSSFKFTDAAEFVVVDDAAAAGTAADEDHVDGDYSSKHAQKPRGLSLQLIAGYDDNY